MTEEKRKERNESRLKECHTGFRSALKKVISDLEADGVRPRIQDAWRSPEDQLKAFNSGHSQLKFGFHNVTSASGKPESLAVDLLDDSSPLKPSTKYVVRLAAASQKHGLHTGAFFGLPAHLRKALQEAIDTKNFDAPLKIGWDPCHVQVTGITPAEAKAGKRPA